MLCARWLVGAVIALFSHIFFELQYLFTFNYEAIWPTRYRIKMAMIFTLDQLQVDELVDTGSFTDAQDPALTIKIGKDSKTTDR